MTHQDIKAIVNEQPFKPFTVHLADGGSHRVSHPDAIAVGNRVAVLIIPAPERESGDRTLTAAIRHITKIEQEESAAVD